MSAKGGAVVWIQAGIFFDAGKEWGDAIYRTTQPGDVESEWGVRKGESQ